MNNRVFNFSSGPAIMPVPVLEKAGREMTSLDGIGMSVMEISHRSDTFERILSSAESGVRELLRVPENYRILFLQGGATLQFSMIPMNFLTAGGFADHVVTGGWGKKAVEEGIKCGTVRTIYSSATSGFSIIPEEGEVTIDDRADYLHYTSNETIDGVEFKYELDGGRVPVVCDMSSNIMSKPVDIEKYSLIYAGAQKNIGPSGVTVVIIRDNMLPKSPDVLPSVLNYRKQAENDSMINTPNTWGIYMIGLVCDWLRSEGGVEAMETRNREKAAILYDAIDSSDGFYRGHALPQARSIMNATFRLPSEVLEKKFVDEATANGLDGLKGHRSVGGIRASIYNAFPRAGVEALIDFMQDFNRRNG